MKIQRDLALHEILLAKMKAPIGLLEYAIDPIAQNRLGKVLACFGVPRNEKGKAIA